MSERLLSTGKIVTFLAIFVALMGLGWFLATDRETEMAEADPCIPEEGVLVNFEPSEGRPAVPEVPFMDNDEKMRSLADYKGRGVVLNFWATWCAPCVREMPQLDRLNAILKRGGIDVLALSQDRKGLPLARKFYKVNNLTDLEILIDSKGKLLRELKGQVLPTTLIIDREGREVGRVAGIAEWDSPEIVGFLKGCLGA